MHKLFLAVALLLGTGDAWATAHHSLHIKIEGMKFNPPSATVHKGDRVIWENEDMVPHTVTEKNGAFDSKTIDPGKSFTYRANKAGKFEYSCLFHPTMKGSLEVQP